MLAVSSDSVARLKKFRSRHGQDVTFISDPNAALISLYGVKTAVLTFAQRTTFVIDQAGLIRAVHRGDEAIDAAQALRVIRQLQK